MPRVRAACLRFQWCCCKTFKITLRSSSRTHWRVSFFNEMGPSKLNFRVKEIRLAMRPNRP